MSSETTPLRTDAQFTPVYVFPGVSPRSRRRQLKQAQCCICAFLMGLLALILVIAISYTIMGDPFPSNTVIENFYDVTTTENAPITIQLFNPNGLSNFLVKDEAPQKWVLPKEIPSHHINDAQNIGFRALGNKEIIEENLDLVPMNSPSYRHQHAISATVEARRKTDKGFVEVRATMHLSTIYNYSKMNGRSSIGIGPEIDFGFDLNVTTNQKGKCDFNSRYRRIDGHCNNKAHPNEYGVAFRPFRRSLNPDYSDGINAPRRAHSKRKLPTARQVSLQVHRPWYSSDPYFTVMLAVWGQFLDHDITATAPSKGINGEPIDCCSPTSNIYPECFPVPLLSDDPYYDKYNLTCMNFLRSAPATTGRFGPREQLNQATSFIDGSVVYGNTYRKQMELRTETNGMLRMLVTSENRTLLPISTDPMDGCNRVEMMRKGKYCFDTGDDRSNENLHLTTMHVIWARHHNYLAENLQKLNPNWNDEIVFQESRKILGAQMQHITYNEFLPLLIGQQRAKVKGLLSDPNSTEDTYDINVNPTIANHFAAAAFRFAHTLIPGLMMMSKDNSTKEYMELHKMLFNPYLLYNERGVDHSLQSAMQTHILKADRFFTKELTQKLFQDDTADKSLLQVCGLDLVSLNIQRGRDHGIPAYYEWRKHCKLSPTDTWEQLATVVDQKTLNSLKKIYADAKDIDLYTGALSEPPLENAIFGPLLMCLISDQFLRLKIGDSHWYERKIGSQSFTQDQLNEIYKTSLAGIICQNSDSLNEIRKFVMQKLNDTNNPIVNCTELTNFNFEPWHLKNTKNQFQAKVLTSSKKSLIGVVKTLNSSILSRKKL